MVLGRREGQVLGGRRVRDLADLLDPGDLLVVNVTRVVPARLRGSKATGGRAEALLLGPEGPDESRRYRALVQCGGRQREGLRFVFTAPGQACRIARIEISHHQFELDPPFPAAWDSQPRRRFPATLVRVIDSEGREGIGSGDVMYGFDDFRHLYFRRCGCSLNTVRQPCQSPL